MNNTQQREYAPTKPYWELSAAERRELEQLRETVASKAHQSRARPDRVRDEERLKGLESKQQAQEHMQRQQKLAQQAAAPDRIEAGARMQAAMQGAGSGGGDDEPRFMPTKPYYATEQPVKEPAQQQQQQQQAAGNAADADAGKLQMVECDGGVLGVLPASGEYRVTDGSRSVTLKIES